MASGLGFENTADKSRKKAPRKKMVSAGLLIAFIALALTLAAWGIFAMMQNSANEELNMLEEEVKKVRLDISNAISDESADFAVRAYTMEDELYREYDSNDVLAEIERIMVLNDNGDRVVLKSFQYNAGAHTKKKFAAGDATITGAGSVTVSADADTFDVMAQQIEAFKDSAYFNNIQVGTTDRDDFGRIVFTLTMDVVGYGKSPYEDSEQGAGFTNTQDTNVTASETIDSTETVVTEESGENVEVLDDVIDAEVSEEETVIEEAVGDDVVVDVE